MTAFEGGAGRDLTPEVDTSERLGPDDMATRREQEFLSAALQAQADKAAAVQRRPGVCMNCGAQCLPLAVYCDDWCRADHERRRLVLARQGRAV